jgi:hypothetical protein
MKIAALFLVTIAATASAFAPASFATRGVVTRIMAEPEEEEGFDLDLGEMFEM